MLARAPALLALALGLAGCVAMPLGTARTIAPGATQQQLGLAVTPLPESWLECDGSEDCDSDGPDAVLPSATWTMRTGLADGLEAGFGVHSFGLHGDLKLALHRSDGFAVAVDPTVSGNFGPMLSGALPLLVDLDLGRAVTLTLAASPSYFVVSEDLEHGALLGLGAGLTVRAADGFALQPGLHWMVPLRSDLDLDSPWALVFAGIGLSFGDQAAP